ncbi:hypothetical protein C5E41_27905 [Nocardia nova]|nr:hypothetical protein C5E41_27905 [Nocardia nova]
MRLLPILTPPLEEQRRIADFLDAETSRIDRLVALQRQVVERLNERDAAVRDVLIDRMANRRGELPLRRFILKIEQGVSPQCESAPRQDSSEWSVLKLSAVKGGVFRPGENKLLPGGTAPSREYEVRPGDLLATRANTPELVGDVAVVSSDCARLLLPDLIYRIGLTEAMDAEYVTQVALGGRVRSVIEAAARGSSGSMVKLRGEDIRSWPVPPASLSEQHELVREISLETVTTGRLRALLSRQIDLLAERRQSLITAAVTGQFDVTTASGRNLTQGV